MSSHRAIPACTVARVPNTTGTTWVRHCHMRLTSTRRSPYLANFSACFLPTLPSAQRRSYGGTLGEHWGNKVPPKIVGVFIYYCNDVKKRPQRGCSIQLVATETADAIMAISVQGNYVIEITVKININE